MESVHPCVSLLIVLFGMGSWVEINGVWAELPLLVSKAPEGWNLPTYLVLMIQVANIGPILFTIIRHFKTSFASLKYTAYLILMVGFLAAIFLSQFWDKHVKVGEKMTSLPLLLLSFIFALTDCTTSVVFLAFMAKYPQQYMIPFYVGEGLSGVVPSLLALSQGTGGGSCYNSSDSTSQSGPRFTVNVFFGLLSVLMAVSGIAFYLLNNTNVGLNERNDRALQVETTPELNKSEEPLTEAEEPRKVRVIDVFFRNHNEHHRGLKWKFVQLYLVTAIVCALGNGVIPSVSSYACLPYGPVSYHLATQLSLLVNPICCFLAFFVACKSPMKLNFLCSFAVLIASIIIYTATLSPTPWLVGSAGGSTLIILLFMLWSGCISYIKVNVASILQQYGENALMVCGIVTQIGSCCGAVVIFFITTKTKTFVPC